MAGKGLTEIGSQVNRRVRSAIAFSKEGAVFVSG